MRDPKRIDKIILDLNKIYLTSSENFITTLLRIIPSDKIYFYIEDSTIQQYIDQYITQHKTCLTECVNEYRDNIDILQLLNKIWNEYPDWRFMQLLINIFGMQFEFDPESCQTVSNDRIIEVLQSCISQWL